MIIELLIGMAILFAAANWDDVKDWIRKTVDAVYNIVKKTVDAVIYFTEIVAERIGDGLIKITHKITERKEGKKIVSKTTETTISEEEAPEWVIRKLDEIERRDKKSKKADIKEEILKDAGVSGEELKHALEH